MPSLTVADRTEVIIDDGLPSQLLPKRQGRARVALLTQPAATTIALEISSRIAAEGLATEVIGLPDREEAKTLDVAASVYDGLARFGLSRWDTVVGVGGGSVTDLAGFVAGTWLRGVEVVHFPTTLLASVDAAIGGKAGVNLAGKNLVGVFWHPSRVVIDLHQLGHLPTFLIREGMAEVYKAGLLGDRVLAQAVSDQGLSAPLGDVVERAIRVKAAHVDADEKEAGVRAHLNLGHTIGHGLEYASTLSHGESVGLGLIAAATISEKLLGFAHTDSVVATIERMGLPTRAEGLDLHRVLDLMGRDKKRDATGLRMVLLEDIERPVFRHVDQADVEHGLAAIGF